MEGKQFPTGGLATLSMPVNDLGVGSKIAMHDQTRPRTNVDSHGPAIQE